MVNSLEIDVFYSMCSPYSYLTLQRYTWLNSNCIVGVNIKVVCQVHHHVQVNICLWMNPGPWE